MKSLRTYKASRRESGFTLVEMAIVLVIIGIILAGVLKGQELITNAKVKALNTDINKVVAAMNAYIDRYKAIPGDDSNASGHVGADTTTNGNGNGRFNGEGGLDWNTGQMSGELLNFFVHLNRSGLLSMNIENGIVHNSLGTPLVLTHSAYGTSVDTLSVCMFNVPGKLVRLYEMSFDDGFRDGGNVLTANWTTNPVVPVDISEDNNVMHLCAIIR